MKTLTKLAGIALITAILGSGCKNEIKDAGPNDTRIPQPRDNQSIILHPDYLAGQCHSGYTLLTDIDNDGKWDLAEKYHTGFTNGDGFHTLYYKKGYRPCQCVGSYIKVEYVEPKFFEAYE